MITENRYFNKPFLRILECYVLKAIGELTTTEETTLRAMESRLCQIFKQQGDWLEIVERTMDLPKEMQDIIREKWVENQKIARKQQITLTGQKFAEMFVDNNFVTVVTDFSDTV